MLNIIYERVSSILIDHKYREIYIRKITEDQNNKTYPSIICGTDEYVSSLTKEMEKASYFARLFCMKIWVRRKCFLNGFCLDSYWKQNQCMTMMTKLIEFKLEMLLHLPYSVSRALSDYCP